MNIKADVCIVGAGPGGALLGYLLAKNNISVVLIERHQGLDHEFRGEHLNNEGEKILKKHLLFKKLEKYGFLFMEKVEYWEQGKVVKEIKPDPKVGHLGIHVPQKHLLSLLTAESLFYKKFQFLLNTKVTEIIFDSVSGNYVGVRCLQNGKEELTIHSKFIIGADGRFSTVRKLANIPVRLIKHGYDLLWAKIPAPPKWEPTIRMAVANNRQLSLFTQAGGYIQIGWNIEEGSFPILRKQPFEPFIKLLIDAFPQLEKTVNKYITSWKDFVFLQVQSCQCSTWVKKGVVLIGDAAHTMSPTGAYGLNSSLKDADILAEYIINMMNEGKIDTSKLKQFEISRRFEVETLQTEQLMKEQTFKNNFMPY